MSNHSRVFMVRIFLRFCCKSLAMLIHTTEKSFGMADEEQIFQHASGLLSVTDLMLLKIS